MANDTQLEWLFPIPVFKSQLDDFDSYQSKLAELANNLHLQDEGVSRSNIGGWHSKDLREDYARAPLDWVGQKIFACASEGLAKSRKVNAPIDIQLDNSWFIINGKNHWNSPHTHMPSQWSGVLYIAVNESNAGSDGGKIIFIDPIPLGPTYRNPINAAMEPKEGMMLIFPSYLTHMVEPHLSDDERISLSFNFRVAVKSQ